MLGMTPRLAAERLELWLFRECNEGARRHLWHLFEFPLEEIRSHHTEHLCLRSILGMISSDAHEVRYWLPADVVRLVIAARDAWQEHGSSGDALDKALEPFSSRVPYENQPDDEGPCTDCDDTGITIQTERRCACQPVDPRDAEIERLKAERDRPETKERLRGVMLEAAHQRARWGAAHDAGKTPLDWFWLLGFLGQKAADAAMRGDTEKALHHTISTAAALANWHLAIIGADNQMRPGIDGEQA